MSDLEQWEAEAEQFYKDTGMLRPGKDDARCWNSYPERLLAFDIWCKVRRKAEQENQALRAALEEIASYDIPECLDPMIPGGIWAARIAKQALAPHDKKQDGGEGT
jgi:hypothetical protein